MTKAKSKERQSNIPPEPQAATAVAHIEARLLDKSERNVRRTATKAADAELKASILAHGLLQNLVVIPSAVKGRYLVIAGGRRVDAIHSLQQEGKLPSDYSAPCRISGHDGATELSLAENIVRQAMHPADEFEAYAALAASHSASEIATRFGVTEKHVLQRLKLGNIAPELIKEYRAEKLTLEALMAFTVTDDHKRQLKVYKSLQGWQRNNQRHIRECLTTDLVEADHKVAKFVGMKAYTDAGGKTRSDLFGDELYLESRDILTELGNAKLASIQRKLEKEGWGWVELSADRDYEFVSRHARIRPIPIDAPADLLQASHEAEAEYERLDAEHDRLWDLESDSDDDAESAELQAVSAQLDAAIARRAELKEQLAEYEDFDPEQKKLAGCYVYISSNGKAEIERGLISKQAVKKITSDDDDESPQPAKKDIPESLTRDLEGYRLEVAQLAVASDAGLAFDLMLYRAAHRVFSRPVYHGADIGFIVHTPNGVVEGAKTPASAALQAKAQLLSLDWMKHTDEPERFRLMRQLPDDSKLALFAHCVAATLMPKLAKADSHDHFEDALESTGVSVAAFWRPTKDNFLGRIKTSQLLALGSNLLGVDWAESRAKAKKGDLVGELHRAFADPDAYTKVAAQRHALKTWLPQGMEFGASPVTTAKVSKRSAAA